MAAYPNLAIGLGTFVELPRGYHTLRTEYEQGYVQTRATSTTAPRRFRLLHEKVPAADVTTWRTFWEARRGGAEAFDFTDPRTGAVISCRFDHDSKNAPPITPIAQANIAFNIGPINLEEAL